MSGTEADTWLIVDQFEELYTLGAAPADRDAFIERLLAATAPDSRLRVVIAVRADFLGRCAEHTELAGALQEATLLAGPMSRDELRDAVVRPAASAGLIVERPLTARILAEVEGEPGGLPMMSHALLETWRHRKGRALTEAAYDAAGGLRGAIVRTAEEVYAEFTGAQAELARRVFLRLIAPGDGTADTRRPTDHDELDLGDAEDTRFVVERLVRARLLTLDDGTVDLAHEALITTWPRLRGWIDAERDRLRIHRQLTDATRTWQQLGRESAALYGGTRLAAAEDAFPRRGRKNDLTPPEQEFLEASVRQRHRAARLRRTLSAVLIALALLASGTALIALQSRATAQDERDAAVFGQITSEADGLRETRTSLAARLDLTAHGMQSTPELYTRLVSDAGAVLSTRLSAHTDITTSVAYSPDGKTLAGAGHDETIRLWDLSAPNHPEPLGEPLRGNGGAIAALAFVPGQAEGEEVVAGAGDNGTVRLWDLSDRKNAEPIGEPLKGHGETIVTMAFTPDGRTMATAGDDGTVRLWDMTDLANPTRLGDPLAVDDKGVRSVAFSPDGDTLASAGFDTRIRLFDVTDPGSPELRGEPLTGHEEPVWSLAFSPDGRTLASGSYDETVRLWDVTDPGSPELRGEPLTGHTAAVWSVAFGPDSRTLVTASQDDTLMTWNVANPDYPQQLGQPLTGHTSGLWEVAFGPDGRTLASVGFDHSVRLWHLPETVLTDFTNPVTSVAYSPDGKLLAAASTTDSLVRLWNVEKPGEPRRLAQPLTGNEGEVRSVAFSPNGKLLASGGEDGTVRLWDVTDPAHPEPLGEPLAEHDGGVLSVAFGPDGKTLAGAGRDGTVRLWDLSDPAHPSPLGEPLTGHEEAVTTVAFGPDGKTLASGGEDNTVRLWDLRDRKEVQPLGEPLAEHINAVTSVAFAPDGDTLASGSADRMVRLWDVTDPSAAEPVGKPLSGHKAPVEAVAYSPDGDTLASAGGDHTVGLWDVSEPAAAAPLGQPLTGHIGTVTTVDFSPDGESLATAGYDLTARVWPLDVDRAVQRVCARTHGVLTEDTWQEHLPQLDFDPPCRS